VLLSGVYLLLQEADFYMYSLYSKNKPKSDDVMAECGSLYFAVSILCSHQFCGILWTDCAIVTLPMIAVQSIVNVSACMSQNVSKLHKILSIWCL